MTRSRSISWMLGLLLAGCARAVVPVHTSPPAHSNAGTGGDIAGTVYDATGAPVGGALVAANPVAPKRGGPYLTRSKQDGTFTMALPSPAKYGLTAATRRAEGTFVADVVTRADATTRLDLRLGREGVTFVGAVRDLAGNGISGALVELARTSSFDGDDWYANTWADGHYEITVPRGQYALSVIAKGYQSPREHSVDDNRERHVDLEVEPDDASFAGPSLVADLRSQAIRLSTTDPDADLDELAAVAKIVGDAHVVGLGEALHGGHEVFELKHRLFRFLVEKMGFTVLGIEASWPDTVALNEYILGGKGDPRLLIPKMRFWIWDTQETLALVEWMRAYNLDPRHPRKLQLLGFDMQYAPTAVQAARAFLARADRVYNDGLDPAFTALQDEYQAEHVADWPLARKQAASAQAAALLRHLDERHGELARRTSEKQWEIARHEAEIARQCLETMIAPGERYNELRDRMMADDAQWIRAHQPGDVKMALWAANAHLAKQSMFGTPPMGAVLAQQLGKDYVALAISFAEGRFRAAGASPYRGIMEFTIPPPPRGSIEGTIEQLEGAVVGVDFNALRPGSEADRWSRYRLRMRSVGSAYSESWGDSMVSLRPAQAFDALFVIRALTPSRYQGPVVRPADTLPRPTNLDFESAEGTRPAGWAQSGLGIYAGYRMAIDTREHVDGRQSVMLARTEPQRMGGYGGMYQTVRAAPFVGKRVRVRAMIRVARPVPDGAAYLYVQSEDRRGDPIDVHTSAPISSVTWQPIEVELDVAARAEAMTYGFAVSGDAPAWIDAVEVAPVSPTPTPTVDPRR